MAAAGRTFIRFERTPNPLSGFDTIKAVSTFACHRSEERRRAASSRRAFQMKICACSMMVDGMFYQYYIGSWK
jgi:hypothetical protein